MKEADKNGGVDEAQVQAYVFGELSSEEAAEVARQIGEHPELREWADKYETIRGGLISERAGVLANTVLKVKRPAPAPVKEPSGKKGYFWAAAASVLMLLSIWGVWQYQNHSPEAIANRHFLMPLNPNVAGVGDNNVTMSQGTDAFFAGQYERSREVFSALSDNPNYGTTARYFLPHAAFLLKDYARASQEFERVLEDENLTEEKKQRARWNTMMADLAVRKEISDNLTVSWPEAWLGPLREELDAPWHRWFY